MMHYAISKETSLGFSEAIQKVTTLLQREGFGILTTIDVQDTLKKKLDTDVGEYVILGACNPRFAYKALQAETDVGLLLPCNVIIYRKERNTRVAAFDPLSMTAFINNEQIRPVAEEVRSKLQMVIRDI
ncbi:MAG TPA: DUF302 domain-containing protein [Bacteroidota bacterium]|nr:DUF302 domain-containing protein [Bacteroidota bacterium]